MRSAWTASLALILLWAVWQAGITQPLFSSGWPQIAGRLSTLLRWVSRTLRAVMAVPRGSHEVIFALLLVNTLGLNPLVAVLAIGIPFGAVTARVFAEIIDETSHTTDRQLRASGSGRLVALAYGVLPQALPDMDSYGFYHLECAVRAAAVLGLVGAGGLGFQLCLSFQSLRYEQTWTLLYALALIGAAVDGWSSLVRRRYPSGTGPASEGRAASEVPRRGCHRKRCCRCRSDPAGMVTPRPRLDHTLRCSGTSVGKRTRAGHVSTELRRQSGSSGSGLGGNGEPGHGSDSDSSPAHWPWRSTTWGCSDDYKQRSSRATGLHRVWL